MDIHIHNDKAALGVAAAREGADAIRSTIANKGHAAIIVATGASQFEMLNALVSETIDWSRVTAFHLDEYVGIGADHPASFRAYLDKRFVRCVSPLQAFIPVNGDALDIEAELKRLNERLSRESIDVCFAGIGENGHLAFNDPPADFKTHDPYIVVKLDEACRRQQLGEGWFETLADVPDKAISMSIHQIMKSVKLILSVPDQRKAEAVKHTVESAVTNQYPASIAQQHADCSLHLDTYSASALTLKNMRDD